MIFGCAPPFMDKRPGRLAACVLQLPTGLVQQMNHTYDTIDAMATSFAACALKCISEGGRGGVVLHRRVYHSRPLSTSDSVTPLLPN